MTLFSNIQMFGDFFLFFFLLYYIVKCKTWIYMGLHLIILEQTNIIVVNHDVSL